MISESVIIAGVAIGLLFFLSVFLGKNPFAPFIFILRLLAALFLTIATTLVGLSKWFPTEFMENYRMAGDSLAKIK